MHKGCTFVAKKHVALVLLLAEQYVLKTQHLVSLFLTEWSLKTVMNFKRLMAIKFAPRKLTRRSLPSLLRLPMSMTHMSALI